MKRFRNLAPLVRAIVVMSAVGIITTGVTFAALTSQEVVLTGNSIQTATADLRVSTDGTVYSMSHAGFSFTGLVPGGAALPVTGNGFYLKNFGDATLNLKLMVANTPTNTGSVDLSKVNVLLTTMNSGLPAQNFTLASLIAANTTGGVAITSGNLSAGFSQQYKLQVSMASDAISGSNASLTNIDFAFTGTAVSS